jgi:hypothetical protein
MCLEERSKGAGELQAAQDVFGIELKKDMVRVDKKPGQKTTADLARVYTSFEQYGKLLKNIKRNK